MSSWLELFRIGYSDYNWSHSVESKNKSYELSTLLGYARTDHMNDTVPRTRVHRNRRIE